MVQDKKAAATTIYGQQKGSCNSQKQALLRYSCTDLQLAILALYLPKSCKRALKLLQHLRCFHCLGLNLQAEVVEVDLYCLRGMPETPLTCMIASMAAEECSFGQDIQAGNEPLRADVCCNGQGILKPSSVTNL